MADKAWKAHERNVAKFFGTTRALHGMDRKIGEVNTDVFVDASSRPPFYDKIKACYAVECKYSSRSSKLANDWPSRELAKVLKQIPFCKDRVVPMILTKDRWIWTSLEDIDYLLCMLMNSYYKDLHGTYPFSPFDIEVRHINKNMSSFFEKAFQQALDSNKELKKEFDLSLHFVCVGSNARLPKAIGFPLDKFAQFKE